MTAKDSVYNTSEYTPRQEGFSLSTCLYEFCYNSGDGRYYWSFDDNCDNETIIYGLSRGGGTTLFGLIDFACVDCDTYSQYNIYAGLSKTTTGYVCTSDAYPIAREDMSWSQALSCYTFENECMPPPSYYWESSTGDIVCNDTSVCGVNQSETIYTIDKLLEQADAEPLYSSSLNSGDYRRFILIKCDAELTPTFTVYGIPIFDYRVWLLIAVIYVLVMFLFWLL